MRSREHNDRYHHCLVILLWQNSSPLFTRFNLILSLSKHRNEWSKVGQSVLWISIIYIGGILKQKANKETTAKQAKKLKLSFPFSFLCKPSSLKGQGLCILSGVRIHKKHLSASPWYLTQNPTSIFPFEAATHALRGLVSTPSSPDSCRRLGKNKPPWNSRLTPSLKTSQTVVAQ